MIADTTFLIDLLVGREIAPEDAQRYLQERHKFFQEMSNYVKQNGGYEEYITSQIDRNSKTLTQIVNNS